MPASVSADPAGQLNPWFETFVPNDAAATVLCFPYSGSGASMFAPWRREMRDGVGLRAARLPGRESRLREPPRDDLLATADEIADSISESELATHQLYLVGFSVGALLAFEVARSLRGREIGIQLLVAASARAPHGRWGRGRLHDLPDKRFLSQLHKRYAAVPDAVWSNQELKQLLLPMLRADIRMFETYRYLDQPPLDCELLALSGRRDGLVKPKHVAPWREQATTFRHRSFDGDHYFVKTHCKEVVATINRRIDRLRSSSGVAR